MSQLFIAVHWRLSDPPGEHCRQSSGLPNYHPPSQLFCSDAAGTKSRDVDGRAVTGCFDGINSDSVYDSMTTLRYGP